MELRQLKSFIKAAEMLSFSDAAKALNIAQSSLSQQIKQLEDELDVKLFLRNSHSIALTEAGKVMLPFALRTIHDARLALTAYEICRNYSPALFALGSPTPSAQY